MTFPERLAQKAREDGTILCLGLDPVPERIEALTGGSNIEGFLESILSGLAQAELLPSTLKPNLAYFEQFGSRGWAILERLLERWRGRCLMILDAKRGDIGRSSEAYARALYEHLGADAVTISPWMGSDSMQPFLDRGPERGAYILLRTSNPGGAELQGPTWPGLADQIREAGAGAVVGATSPEGLAQAHARLGSEAPLLIPGVGAQGGDASEVKSQLQRLELHRVNVSSGILYAGEKSSLPYLEAAVEATRTFRSLLSL